ncbi:MAG: hypothetical protein H0X29_09000 [Parachlamydiaceae bacterium]|nr:hypothetical protein [Parachlamydiaceae bacterium]
MASRFIALLKSISISFPFLLLFSLSSCLSSRLAVYTDYLTRENLASYHVDTPDPFLNRPVIGQRLIITWSLKKRYLLYQDLHLKIDIRFRNRKEVSYTHSLFHAKGTYVYALINQDYIDNKGILTYKVELIGDGQILDEWRHQIWSKLILIGQNTPSTETRESLDIESEKADEFEMDDLDF